MGLLRQVSADIINGVTQNTDPDNPANGNTLMALSYNGCEPAPADGSPFADAIWKGTVYVPQQSTFINTGLSLNAGNAYVTEKYRGYSC